MIAVLVMPESGECLEEIEAILDLVDATAEVYTDVEEALFRVAGVKKDPPWQLAVVGLNFMDFGGAQVCWLLRQRFRKLPIILHTECLGSWAPEDLHDCGVNVILERPVAIDEVTRKVREILRRLPQGRETVSGASYEAIVAEACGSTMQLARIVDESRLIVYETPALQRLCGDNRGKSCFAFWGASDFCRDCVALAAFDGKASIEKFVKNSPYGQLTASCVAVVLPDGRPAVVESFIMADSCAGSDGAPPPASPKASQKPGR